MKPLAAVVLLTCSIGCSDTTLDAFQLAAPAENSGLLDDFEDQNNQAGQDGWWYPQDDGTGPDAIMTFDAVTGRGDSLFAVRLRAGPTLEYGAFLGLDLPGGVYDATAFDRLSFFARAELPIALRVRLLDSIFEIHDSDIELGTEWQAISLPLSAFLGTDTMPVEANELTHLQFWIVGPSPAFDVWIDDVWFRTAE